MEELLVLIHTVSPLIAVFDHLCAELLPGVTTKHVLDEPLLEVVRQRGELADNDTQRLLTHIGEAEAIGARAVLVTCSTISPLVDSAHPSTHMPIYKIDQAMMEEAIRLGTHIGVLATNPTTIKQTLRLLQEQASKVGKSVSTETRLVQGALDALLGGDGATHDRLLSAAIQEISPRVDAVVLAQASMSRVLADFQPSAISKPILSSPHLALEQLRTIFR